MPYQITLPRFTEEDALARIISWLKRQNRSNTSFNPSGYVHDLYVPDVIGECLKEALEEYKRQHNIQGFAEFHSDTVMGSKPFYGAAWELCVRGILRPDVTYPWHQSPNDVIGGGFSLTEYGRKWLSEISGYECIPSEHGRFAQLLAEHSARFGKGYHSRSQEAVSCYRAHAYLACCAMCGAAAESILLALAIAKKGNEEEVLREYRTTSGRTKIERMLVAQQNSYVQQEIPIYTALLKYWRDDAAHGTQSSIQEGEAFTSLILLLRFAQFADEQWDELTSS